MDQSRQDEPTHTEKLRSDPAPSLGAAGRSDPDRLGLSLLGSLPCVGCGYELQGLSVRGVCPECGTRVRATILHTVDPNAEELRPMPWPRVTALGLLLWSFGGVIATLLCWAPHVGDFLEYLMPLSVDYRSPTWLGPLTAGFAAVSGIGAIGMIRPTLGAARRNCVLAILAVLAYVPLCWILLRLALMDRHAAPRYFVAAPDPDRLAHRAGLAACLLVIILCIRPCARMRVHRCMALRLGRVDRQTLLAMALVVGLAAVGDAARLASLSFQGATQQLLRDGGTVIIAISSILFAGGAIGSLLDSVRIARAIVRPAPGLRQILGARQPAV